MLAPAFTHVIIKCSEFLYTRSTLYKTMIYVKAFPQGELARVME